MGSTAAYTYLDHAATTPMRPQAVAAMLPFLSEHFANPSGSHRFARESRRAVDEARDLIAEIVGCRPGEVIFTSGGTESDNTAIFGAVASRGGTAACSAVEHHAVLECVHKLKGDVIAVTSTGEVDLDALATILRRTDRAEPVAVLSVMAVNNEVGTINDLSAVRAVLRRESPDTLLHTDAVQAACWLDLRAITPHVDFMSLSGHKFGGPKGIGVLVARNGAQFAPAIIGGGQERERRSGTHNVPGIVAMAEALRITDAERAEEVARVAALRDRLVSELGASIAGLHETVKPEHKVAGSAHVCIEGIENEALLYLLDEVGVCASAASACSSGAMEPSHVLAAMGISRALAGGALRLTLGSTTTDDDISRGVEGISTAVERLRRK